jgi:hypothetical protein
MDHYFRTLITGASPLCTIQHLKAECDEETSNFAFSFKLCRYTKAFGHERKNFLEMVEVQDDVGDFIEKINNLLTNYNISQGSLARSVNIPLSFLLITGAKAKAWCLLIHAEASLSLLFSLINLARATAVLLPLVFLCNFPAPTVCYPVILPSRDRSVRCIEAKRVVVGGVVGRRRLPLSTPSSKRMEPCA